MSKTLIPNNNYIININKNLIQTIEEEKITTVNKDYDVFANKDLNVIVKESLNIFVDEDVTTTIRNILHNYVEKDKQEKFLQNLYLEVSKDFGLQIDNNLHITSNHLKYEVNKEIDLDAYSEVILRCGNNSMSINSSGVYFHTSNYNSNSPYSGVVANDAEILKSLFSLDSED